MIQSSFFWRYVLEEDGAKEDREDRAVHCPPRRPRRVDRLPTRTNSHSAGPSIRPIFTQLVHLFDHSTGPSSRSICARCRLTMTYIIQICSNCRCARVSIINTRPDESRVDRLPTRANIFNPKILRFTLQPISGSR